MKNDIFCPEVSACMGSGLSDMNLDIIHIRRSIRRRENRPLAPKEKPWCRFR
jgi:hypothetical protein